jgi:signal transduction histidine kinase
MPEPRPETISTDHDRSERLHVFAHDLRNRITGMWEVMKALRASDPAMDPDELFAFAEKGYFQAQREIEELMDDFHVDRRVRITDVGPVLLADVIAETLKREHHRLERKVQSVSIIGDQHLHAKGDAHWIGQILQALISNASKFSSRGSSIHLAIELSGPKVRLQVKDTGVGMTEADLEQVFIRFALLASRSTDGEQQSRGTLARARQWSEAMHGSLAPYSTGEGQGCTFTLELPAAD